MTLPEHTATANRDTLRAYAMDIIRVCNALEPTLAEIQECDSTLLAAIPCARRWRTSEALCLAAEKAQKEAHLRHLSKITGLTSLMPERLA